MGGILGVALAWAFALPLGPRPLTASVAFASGLGGGPTMLANDTPADLYPRTLPDTAPPKINGIFAPDFAVGTAITFTEDLSRAPAAPDPTASGWHWVFGDGTTASGTFTPAHTYKKPGTYVVHAQFPDAKKKLVDVDTAQIHIVAALPTNPPVARATISPSYATWGSQVTLDASASTAADGSKLTYLWNFNDGQTATDARVTHQFAIGGRGVVSLTVTDGHGAKGVTTLEIIAPRYQLGTSASTIAPGKSITFTVAATTTPGAPSPDGQTDQQASYTWDFGDGSDPVTSSQPSVSHTYAKVGHYLATMQEMDGLAPNQTTGPFEAVMVSVAVPPPPPWRYVAGGVAVALGVLISLAATARSERRKAALVARAKAARSQRGGASGGYYEDDDDAGWDERPPRGRGARGGRGGSSARRPRARDDRW